MVKGLKGEGVEPVSRSVRPIPDFLKASAFELWAATMDHWAKDGFRNEFALLHEGQRYRCARIGGGEENPNESISDRSLQSSNVSWCLRRVEGLARELDDIGMPSWLLKEIKSFSKSHGLLLITGTFGSGKTTTASAAMSDWVRNHGGIGICLEDPPEIELEGHYPFGQIFQKEVHEDDFATAVHRAKRWSADYFYLGEIRSAAAASQLMSLSTIGPMSISTIHGAGPVEALIALTTHVKNGYGDYDLAKQLVANTVKGVLHQKIENGIPVFKYLSMTGVDSFSIKNKILQGKFGHLHEELDMQERRRISALQGYVSS